MFVWGQSAFDTLSRLCTLGIILLVIHQGRGVFKNLDTEDEAQGVKILSDNSLLLIIHYICLQVMLAKSKLHHWETETDECRRECAELAFFSNEKVMRILGILQSNIPSSVDLVKEIAFLYKSDQETNKQLALAVQVEETIHTDNFVIFIICRVCYTSCQAET